MVSYEGIFFVGEDKDKILSYEKIHLPIINDELHCTFVYHPKEEELWDDLIGEEFEIKLIGYACNGKNSGFQIELPEEIKKYYKNTDGEKDNELKIPHITASVTKDSKPYFTKDLKFVPLEQPIPIKGKFGYWIKEDNKEFLSFEKRRK